MVAEPGTYRSPTGPNGEHETHDQWSARKQAEAAAQKREAGLEARLSALETRIREVIESTRKSLASARKSSDARYSEVVEAVGLAFGDLREEMHETHETLVGRQVQRATKDASRAFANEIQKLRNEITFLERRVKELEAKRGTK